MVDTMQVILVDNEHMSGKTNNNNNNNALSMRINYVILLLLFKTISFAQQTEIDSSAIKFKANLFTLSEFGIASKEQILSDIENQEVSFLKTFYKEFYFLKVKFSQPYRRSNKSITTLIRNCTYYLAFNNRDKKFYRLGGFDMIDIDEFIEDLEDVEVLLTNFNGNEIEEIDIDCLYKYHKLSKKQRLKKGFKCFKNCRQDTKTAYIEY